MTEEMKMKDIDNHIVIVKPNIPIYQDWGKAIYKLDNRISSGRLLRHPDMKSGFLAMTERAFTLIEMMVVVGIIALLMVFGMPAMRTMVNSFHSEGNTRAMINSALCCARAIAAKEQTYTGVRFQKTYTPGDTELLNSAQYMIFIIHDPNKARWADGFYAMEGMAPIKLPESVGVSELKVRTNPDETKDDEASVTDGLISTPAGLQNVTTFSVIFSPSGKLVIHDARVWNKDGKVPTSNASRDDIFNTQTNVVSNRIGMFYQDDNASVLGLGQERSRNSFIIYDTNILKRTDTNFRWRDYLSTLQPVYVNPYTGTIINNK
jgi:prepilin-type N-terminal cleavage/methylation domain-containing protein